MAGVFLFIAAFCVRFVDDKDDVVVPLPVKPKPVVN